jgi:predicted metal-binding protein
MDLCPLWMVEFDRWIIRPHSFHPAKLPHIPPMKHISAHWDATILICKKCSKKVGGGFGDNGKTSLAKALRATGNGKRGRKADRGIFEMGCQKICPKNAVVAINAARPHDWLIVPRGADLDEVTDALGFTSSAAAAPNIPLPEPD